MEAQEDLRSQNEQLILAHKLFLLTYPNINDIDKVHISDEVLAAVKSHDMAPVYESLAARSLLEIDASVLKEMKKKIQDEIRKLDEKLASFFL